MGKEVDQGTEYLNKGAVHGHHSIPPPKGTPSSELLEVGKKTTPRGKKSWLPDSDIFGHLIDHQDDEQVKTMAAEIDKDTPILSKRAEKKMDKMVVKDAKEVDTAMAKEIKEEK